jgi:hypothetical protein
MTGLLPRRLQVALYRTSTYWRLAQVSLLIIYLVVLILLFRLWMPRDFHENPHAVRDLPDIPPAAAVGGSSLAPIDRAVQAGSTLLSKPERIGHALDRMDEALADPERLERAMDRVLGTTDN